MRTKAVRRLGVFSMLFLAHLGVQSCSSSSEGEEDVAATEEGNAASNENGDANSNLQANEGNAAAEGNLAQDANATGEPAATAEVPENGTNGALQDIVQDMNATAQTAPTETAEAAAPTTEEAVASTPVAVGAGPAGGALPEFGSKMPYIVQPGDTLAKISAKVYGEAGKWKLIANLSNLQRPNKIYPGDVVYYQLTQASQKYAQAYETVPRQEVMAKQGDTLATIAKRTLGSSSHWKAIWRQNDQIDNPDTITPGQPVYYINPQQLASLLNGFKASTFAVSKKITNRVLGLETKSHKEKSALSRQWAGNKNSHKVEESEIDVELVVSGISAILI